MKKLKKLSNKILFLFYVNFLYKPDKKSDLKNNINEIAVIGRGKSANYYFEKLKNSPKVVALVNFTDHDFENIDISVLNKKNIYFFFNIEGAFLSLKYLLKLNIKGVMRTSNKEISRSYNKQSKLHKFYLDKLPEFPEHLNDFKYLRNSGLLSIVYMVDYFKPQKVLLFGFNFYQGEMIRNYSSQEHILKEELISLKKTGKNLVKNFQKLCKSYKHIKFYRFDDNEIEKISNLTQINTN
tara:strand:- start:19 stop:735 length:717 start_codon:yes stop_codon:yes gene_type:complete